MPTSKSNANQNTPSTIWIITTLNETLQHSQLTKTTPTNLTNEHTQNFSQTQINSQISHT